MGVPERIGPGRAPHFKRYVGKNHMNTNSMKEYLYNGFKDIFAICNKKIILKKQFNENIEFDHSSKIIRLINEIDLFKQLFSITDDKVLYHYTNSDSLINIIKSNKLKFSGVAGFNDANELRSKSTIFGKSLKNPYNKNRMNIINNRFVFCLSKRQDDLNQWRLYGNDGKGVCLGFKKG